MCFNTVASGVCGQCLLSCVSLSRVLFATYPVAGTRSFYLCYMCLAADPVSGTLSIVLISVGVFLAVVITIYISWLARREFRKEMRRGAAEAESS